MGYADWQGSEAEMLDTFQNGMQWEIREQVGGAITWQGFLAEMELTRNGITYRRSWSTLANRVKAQYSKIGSNLITNSSCETAVWDALFSPTTLERSTCWATQGSYSAHIVADSQYDGVTIQSSITVEAGKAYQGQVTVKIVSGTWRLELKDPITKDMLDFDEQSTAGQWVLYVNLSNDNALTNLRINLSCQSTTGEIYADAAVFQLAPARAETAWYQDTVSQAEYGVIEAILSGAGMTDSGADAWAQRTLYANAYAKARSPGRIRAADAPSATSLSLVFCGYAFTLRNKYSWLRSQGDASNIITAVIGDSEFVGVGAIDANTLQFGIEERDAYRAWDLIRDITESGDADGNRWMGGVYADRKFYYKQASTEPVARIRNGKLLDANGGPLDGWFAEPGSVYLDDLPMAYDYPSGRDEDRARLAWMNEVEFDLGAWLEGKPGVAYAEAYG